MHGLMRYWGVYREFLANAFAEASSYRLHFVLLIVMDQLFYFSSLGSVSFIFDHVNAIGPWERDEFMFFTAFMLAVDHLHMTFISESFWNFSFDLRTGRLDFVLLRPLNTIFSIFFRYIRPATMINFVTPWAFLIHFGRAVDLGVGQWVSVPFLVVASLVFLVSIEILISMLMFWTVEAFGINFLRMQLQNISRWPDFVYRGVARRFFTLVIPVLLVGSAPVKAVLNPEEDASGLLWMLIGLVLIWVAIRFVWKLGLRSYESASS
ncbi:MAG TPA: ABC-2 family transporter protein [Oligoflexus sp.]|uniref:ABC transporter permease n=1 Tax=Oligoflexus sp. TaxID=1971216 RepID=UPI002D7E943A|nr:ABC-2 family transporter protein [Oligoflexus sp.]HET9239304.1 ABC-2 family transporter protein [Oligoflexus sp.]